ncbi:MULTISPECIES: plasmid partitioning protein RepB [Bosea]|uniref:Plasmid partitioning protein RepB n=1 Tax=Bosea spartocytisi TaxID=2773451 RepID=A0A927ED83_9HYPH|nr:MULTISPECIES: plasmid partitioning protein RepB [Bosea]MBD3849138.1 plasmid partitioning protein RepB [Bosea spartocytisi]MCT4475320.1 plasmid partitioning protein RepB [Bosea spartocytisi]
MSRKDAINSLFLRKPEPAAHVPPKNAERVRTGAIAAMGSSLQEMTEGARAAERLHQQLAEGEVVLSLEAAQIEGSRIADRIAIDVDPGFETLVESIRERGQQVPILVRPHPEKANHFQIVYGRRRLRVATRLGRPVKAIVRNLTDAELVIAQGRENLDRADLTFIEKAFFARRLEDAGYDRSTILAALSTDKSDLSRYIAIARRLPEQIVQKIGPAAKTGRARWIALADKLEDGKAVIAAENLLSDPETIALDSDGRFQAVLKAVDKQPKRASKPTDIWVNQAGKRAGRVERSGGKTALVFNEKVVPEFATWISSRLDDLYAEFSTGREEERSRS